MKQYLVMYTTPNYRKKFTSVKTWPELQTMLNKMEVVGGSMRIYRLDRIDPERVWAVLVKKGTWYLEDMFGNKVEG